MAQLKIQTHPTPWQTASKIYNVKYCFPIGNQRGLATISTKNKEQCLIGPFQTSTMIQ